MEKPTQRREPSVIQDQAHFRELIAKQFMEALADLLERFPQARSLALVVDWDDSLPALPPLAWKTQPGCNRMFDLLRMLNCVNEAGVLLSQTLLQELSKGVKGDQERGGAGTGNGGVHPSSVEQRS